MKTHKKILAASVGAALAMGAAGEAAASIYAGTKLEIQDLQILILAVNAPAVTTYTFDLQNTAVLNGVGDFTFDTCSGGGGGAQCLPADSAPDVLYGGPAQVGIALPDQSFGFVGPNSGQEYARADSVIINAELADGTPTHTINNAEAELVDGTAASAASTIQSTTALTFTFTVDGPGTFQVSFDADPDLLASIQDPPPGGAANATAQASVGFQAQLTQDAGVGAGSNIIWSPSVINGALNPCDDGDVSIVGATFNCNGVGDGESSTEDLNTLVSVSTLPTSSLESSWDPVAYNPGEFFLQFSFVNPGTYTFALVEEKAVLVTRTEAIPEPGTLLLLGSGFLGAGLLRRKRKGPIAGKTA